MPNDAVVAVIFAEFAPMRNAVFLVGSHSRNRFNCFPHSITSSARASTDDGQNSQCCARDLDREGIGERHFLETVEAARGAGVTGVEVGAKGNQVVALRAVPDRGTDQSEYRNLPTAHAVEPDGLHERRLNNTRPRRARDTYRPRRRGASRAREAFRRYERIWRLPSADYSWRRGFFGGERGLNRPAHV